MFPIAHIACSYNSGLDDFSRLQKIGIPPLSIMVYVYWKFPEATLVKAQADSSYK